MAEQQLPPPDVLRERAIKRLKERQDSVGLVHPLVNSPLVVIRAGS